MQGMEPLSGNTAIAITDLLTHLQGRWELTRSINDLRQDMPGSMRGAVDISRPDHEEFPPVLNYHEEGELVFGDYREIVFRRYRYSFPDPFRALVHFDDGRVFHELDLRTGFWQAEHHCGQDIYKGEFRVESGDIWFSRWKVNGPSKELVLDNRFQRLS